MNQKSEILVRILNQAQNLVLELDDENNTVRNTIQQIAEILGVPPSATLEDLAKAVTNIKSSRDLLKDTVTPPET